MKFSSNFSLITIIFNSIASTLNQSSKNILKNIANMSKIATRGLISFFVVNRALCRTEIFPGSTSQRSNI